MIFAIIDDELAAREEMEYLIKENFKNVDIVQFETGQQVLDYPDIDRIDAAFIDMNLGDIDGLSVGRALKESNPQISLIFATAYDQYALDSFELGTFDYLTKPLDPRRFDILVERLKTHFENSMRISDTTSGKVLNISFNKKQYYINMDRIVYIESANRNTYIYTSNDVVKTTESMSSIESKLDSNFMRVHKSYIVNLDFVTKMEYFGHNQYDIKLSYYEDVNIPLSRNKIKEFKELANKRN